MNGKKSNIYRLTPSDSKFILSGATVVLKINKSVFNKQKKPYSDCDFIEDENGNFEYPSSLFDRKYYDQIKSAGYEYSQSMCISFCQLDKIGNNCTFRFSSINAPNNIDYFCPDKKLNVANDRKIFKIFNDYFNQYFLSEEIDRFCSKKCPLECKTENYDIFQTKTEYYPNILNLFISYNSLSYLNYEESPTVSIYNLVSNIGGVIGLLLGMSLLSIFEVLELIFINIYLIIKHKLIEFRKSKKLDV